MRVQVTSKEKEFLRVCEMPAVRRIIEEMKEDEMSLSEYALMAVRTLHCNAEFEIYRPKAVIAKNCRVSDRYFEGSGNLDVWIRFLAFDAYYGAFDCGVYLSDIWDLSEDNRSELREKMYVNAFERKEEDR